MSESGSRLSTIVPSLRYRDAPAMIEWLCRVLGFERHAVYDDGEGGIAHAQLRFGDGMLMLGSTRDDAWGARFAAPADVGNRVTQSCYCIVADTDGHYARAKAAGAEIIDEPHNPEHGGRAYSCRDPEGQLWSFGSYDPWQAP